MRGSKTFKKRDGNICHRKSGFRKKGRLNLRAVHLQKNYEMKELVFSISHYSIIHHFSTLFKR